MAPRSVRSQDVREFRFAEFFAGIGLMRAGLQRDDRRWRCVFANDLDPKKRRIYAEHFGTAADEVDGTDVHRLPADRVPSADLATASFPCTDLSLAGGRAGIRSGESSAFWGFHRILEEQSEKKRPRLVLLENVVGFLSSHEGRDFRDALRALNELGYRVDPFVLDARWFVPQSRPRLFVVATRGERTDGGDGRDVTESRVRPKALVEFIRAHVDDVAWNLRALPEPPARSATRLADVVRDPADDDASWWNAERTAYFLNQTSARHREWIERHREAPGVHYATAFRRVRRQADGSKRSMAELRTDGLAGCLRTPKGGSGRQILVRAGGGRVDVRLLNADECAALMGVPDYRIDGKLNDALFAFGDAVCVDAVQWISRHYLVPMLELR